MKPVIYIDVLFFVNLIINYILLFTAATIGRLPYKRIRITVASFAGGLYAVGMFFPNLNFIYSMGAKIMSVFAIVAIAYNIRGLKLYFKSVCYFGLVTICFGGGAFMVLYFTDIGAAGGAVISNGILYFNLPWQILTIGIALSYLIIRVVLHALRGKSSGGNDYAYIKIVLDKRETTIRALVDTGNALYDPISSYPVIVAEFESLTPVLSEDLQEIYRDQKNDHIEYISAFTYTTQKIAKVRIIPYSSLGTDNGIMLGFVPDKALLLENETEKDMGKVIIGIYDKQLSADKSFQGLLHPQIMCQ